MVEVNSNPALGQQLLGTQEPRRAEQAENRGGDPRTEGNPATAVGNAAGQPAQGTPPSQPAQPAAATDQVTLSSSGQVAEASAGEGQAQGLQDGQQAAELSESIANAINQQPDEALAESTGGFNAEDGGERAERAIAALA